MKPYIIGFYGASNSGKTSLIEKLIKYFSKEGYSLASMKITDKKIGVDSKGKDTSKHAEAGSNLVVFSSANETDFLVKEKMDCAKILDFINYFGNFDLVIVEGANDENITNIRIGDIARRPNTVFTYDGDFEKIIDFIKDKM